MIGGANAWPLVEKISSNAQAPARPSVIQIKGTARAPFAPANHAAPITSRVTMNPITPGLFIAGLAEAANKRNDSAAQSARTRCSNGNQRKLQRKTLAVGSRQSSRTRRSNPSSHLMARTNARPKAIRLASKATGETKPHASSVAVCGTRREEKSAQFTVQFGRMKAGKA